MRHMSVQLVPDLAEEGAPFVPLLLPFDPLGPFAIHDSEDPATPGRFRDDHVDRIGRRGENGHDLRHVPDGPEDVDRKGVPEEDDEEVARAHRERVLRGEGLEVVRIPFHADETWAGGLAERQAEVDSGNRRDELALVATTIQVHFANVKARERALVEFMAIRFRWPASRTRRRLAALVDLGILRCSRDLADNWTKVFEVIDRPHVPAALAVEM